MFEFEWDPAKAASNARKHGVSFEDAATVFANDLLLSMLDDEHGGGEERWISQGQTHDGQLLVVVHTWRELDDRTLVRIISARRTTPRERRRYELMP